MNELTARHRAQQLLLRRATVVQLIRLWPMLDWQRLDESFPEFAAAVGALVQRNRRTSAGIAAQYVTAMRRLKRSGDPRLVFPPALDVDQLVRSLHVTSVAAIKSATGRGTPQEESSSNALVYASGAMSRLVLDAGRELVRQTSIADPDARGWRRVGDTNSCEFCTALINDDVIGTPEIDFKAHDHCGCSSEIVYL